ncbi:hypothetical protein EYF80_007343 [Liparis tanakae]|uniref:Uncharacterized protein n=1 Tax=Liparis tanakae TaxID=230148 RepID=A0A4Z2IYD5_9TELE|nr:hypothetical protein EYF80_007343 [Liparis tanakae]
MDGARLCLPLPTLTGEQRATACDIFQPINKERHWAKLSYCSSSISLWVTPDSMQLIMHPNDFSASGAIALQSIQSILNGGLIIPKAI